MSTQGKRRATELIRAIMEHSKEPEPYHNLVLAAEAVRDVGQARTEGDLAEEIQGRLRQAFATPLRKGNDLTAQVQRRAAAAEALGKIESGGYGAQPAFWTLPYGEPVWVEIPAGEFWMGSEKGEGDEKPVHRVYLDRYWIAKTPITNAQYRLFVEASGHRAPRHWENGKVPRGLENHPVVRVTWRDVTAYCKWLSQATHQDISLPSEAQWEYAARGADARGDKDQREYPWGEVWKEGYCNSEELGLDTTTPVGIFPEGASHYGCLDLAGNVWEWCRDWYAGYARGVTAVTRNPQGPEAGTSKVLRGGAYWNDASRVRCAYRSHADSGLDYGSIGFRVARGSLR